MRWMRFPAASKLRYAITHPAARTADLIRPSGTFPLQKGKALNGALVRNLKPSPSAEGEGGPLAVDEVSPLQAGHDAQAPERLQHLKPSPSAEGEGGPLAVDEVSPLQAGCDTQAGERLQPRPRVSLKNPRPMSLVWHTLRRGRPASNRRSRLLASRNPFSCASAHTRSVSFRTSAQTGVGISTLQISERSPKSVIANQCAHWCGNPFPCAKRTHRRCVIPNQ